MSANFSAAGVVSVRPIADTYSYMYVGISIDEAVTTYYEDKKNWHPLRFCIHLQVLTLSKSKKVQEGGNWKRFWLGGVVGVLLGGRRMQQPTINGSGESD